MDPYRPGNGTGLGWGELRRTAVESTLRCIESQGAEKDPFCTTRPNRVKIPLICPTPPLILTEMRV